MDVQNSQKTKEITIAIAIPILSEKNVKSI
jgi:hypothetical protein